MKILIILLTSSINIVATEKIRFDNYTLFKVLPQNQQQIQFLRDLQNSKTNLDFWSDPLPSAKFVTIMSNPEEKDSLESYLDQYGINFQITINDIQQAIDKENVRTYTRNSRNMAWDSYYTLNDIDSWLSEMAAAHPSIVTEVTAGMSYEGREIKGFRIAHGEGKRVIFIEAGIHAREWIVPSMACYIINELLTSEDEETKAAARDFEWYIFPVVNPDGYVWSHESFRLWRKNRRPVGSEFGIDLNRNWNNNWMVIGADADPASDNYAGLGPFSEPESRGLSSFITSVSDRMDIYIAFHSFGQCLLLPFGNTTDHLANYYDAVNIGRRAMGALSVRHGTQYVTGTIAETYVFAGGSSLDWVKERLNIPLAYAYELRDQGTYGFLLPTDQILPNHLEAMDSVLELIHQAKRFGYLNSGYGFLVPNVLIVSFMVLFHVIYSI